MLLKCRETRSELEEYLLIYRNILLVNIGKSPEILLQNKFLKQNYLIINQLAISFK